MPKRKQMLSEQQKRKKELKKIIKKMKNIQKVIAADDQPVAMHELDALKTLGKRYTEIITLL